MVETPGERLRLRPEQAAWSGLQGMYGCLLQRIDADPKRTHRLSHAAFAARFRLPWADGHCLGMHDLAAHRGR